LSDWSFAFTEDISILFFVGENWISRESSKKSHSKSLIFTIFLKKPKIYSWRWHFVAGWHEMVKIILAHVSLQWSQKMFEIESLYLDNFSFYRKKLGFIWKPGRWLSSKQIRSRL